MLKQGPTREFFPNNVWSKEILLLKCCISPSLFTNLHNTRYIACKYCVQDVYFQAYNSPSLSASAVPSVIPSSLTASVPTVIPSSPTGYSISICTINLIKHFEQVTCCLSWSSVDFSEKLLGESSEAFLHFDQLSLNPIAECLAH